MKIQNFLRQWC